ncbi:hypothetical protein TorRG33x02_336040 [Trema orientale]|uniref:Reverse transcriptase zinc-binding domain-containing protein n=1 Tax=Trema orientale TaxID=63057 RepID=A0A2P5B0E6_TREOI|nr:hypothetical protein TorRG33x02_336040 [Trema orientale]
MFLVARVLKSKYFFNCSFLDAPLGCNPLYIWHSLIWGRDMLSQGLRWQIGNGNNVRIWADPWMLRTSTFRPITPSNLVVQSWKVANLILDNLVRWNVDIVNQLFWYDDRVCILRNPLSLVRRENSLIWHYDYRETYKVKSGYRLAMAEK